MTLACKLKGHQIPLGYGSVRPYLELKLNGVDGCGTRHATLWGECPRCNERYHVASIHIPKEYEKGERERAALLAERDRLIEALLNLVETPEVHHEDMRQARAALAFAGVEPYKFRAALAKGAK